jgi:hypothetical protein
MHKKVGDGLRSEAQARTWRWRGWAGRFKQSLASMRTATWWMSRAFGELTISNQSGLADRPSIGGWAHDAGRA